MPTDFNIIPTQVEEYVEKHTTPEDDLLREIAEYTRNNHPEQQMLSGHLQGKILEMVSRMINPSRILEIGTFTGYSALCLAKGLRVDGQLHTIELRPQDADLARGYFNRSEYNSRIISHVGNALEIISGLNEVWDLVFIDADKTGYIEYFNLVLPHLRKNGFILADNVLFHGEVLKSPVKGKNAKAISEFNEFIRKRNDIDKTILTLRDGLYLIRKS